MIPYRLNPLGVNEYVPLTLKALEDSSTVKMIVSSGSPTVSGLKYRKRGQQWTSYSIDTDIHLDAGEWVQFMNEASTLNSSGNTVRFAMTGKISAFGDLMSMLNASSCSNNCFDSLFYNNAALYSCRDLKFPTVLASSCFQSMFSWCQYLYKGPKILPATTLANSCYAYMFQGDFRLEYMAELPATVPASWCYRYMYAYMGAGNAEVSATKPIRLTSLADYCCAEMFSSAKISRLEVDFTAWTGTESTANWVNGVPATGTFVKPTALAEETGASRIPSGWDVENK